MDSELVARGESTNKRILVVEDERIISRDICKTLQEMGYVCATASSSSEALDQAAACGPDLVLMDIRIDGQQDGIEVAAELKSRHQVPVVFLTGNTDEGTLQRAFRVDPNGYLAKPFTRATLRSAIEVAIQRHGSEERLRLMNLELIEQKGQLERRAGELRLLSEMGDFMQLCESADEVMAIVARFGQQLFPDDAGVLYLIDGSGEALTATASWGLIPPSPSGFDLDGCRALRRGRTHRVVRLEDQLRCAHVDPSPAIGSVCVPMMATGSANGVLSVSFPLAGVDAAAGWAREQLVAVLAQRISLTLTNLRIKDQLKRESILDPLTGLFNRRYMAIAFDRELRHASRTERPLGVLIFDIDRFKQVNDRFGHIAADRMLCELATLLQSRLRAYDVPIRYGGDEMVVLLPDTTIEGASAVADKLLQGVRTLEVRYREHLISMTISAGVAAYPLNGTDPESILRAADLALLRAKSEGCNRVVVATAERSPPSASNGSARACHNTGKP